MVHLSRQSLALANVSYLKYYQMCYNNNNNLKPMVVVLGKADDSCVGRCGIAGTDLTKPCQCNPSCQTYNDCCADFLPTCNTCAGRCTAGYDTKWPCQCNADCSTYNNCCPDKPDLCGGTGKTHIFFFAVQTSSVIENFYNSNIRFSYV